MAHVWVQGRRAALSVPRERGGVKRAREEEEEEEKGAEARKKKQNLHTG